MTSHARGKKWIPGLLILLLGAGSLQAQNNVLFLDGGYTELCANLAKRDDDPTKIAITGSRLEHPPIEICSRAIREESSARFLRARNYNNRGVLYFAQGALAQAQADFEQAIMLQDELARAHINLGYTLVAQERWNESIAPLTRGIELGAEDLPKAYYNRGIAFEETGQVASAYRDYQMAAELAPDWEAPRQELSRFSVRRGAADGG
ncbi:MAG TPA: tetratricopeptide repeat protein [Hyphomicrobiales bacterium]|nr:tetratricopeptide repeat protein [Hyphomicrobiales bacterium]